ncbi:MAG: tetratricopeptide repeat protein [Gammaproteobacteria bacterium]|nr:tetratricopeptide repeat protein [Gammaproteobacteria bacterium]
MNGRLIILILSAGLYACGSAPVETGTLAELTDAQADLNDVFLEDGLERAAQSYRQYLEESDRNERTPEAMRRLADLQIEQAYGVLGSGDLVEMAVPETAEQPVEDPSTLVESGPVVPDESDLEFETRATQREVLLSHETDLDDELLSTGGNAIPAGPREAIETYKEILETYPNYERNDRVLYQMSRAYDEIGQPDDAMTIMDRFVSEYPFSRYVDEVQFRRGEYYFVRKQWLNAEEAYSSVIGTGSTSSFYELALYKLGWTLYKQFLYEEALHRFMAMLDYQLVNGYDFDRLEDEDDEHRVSDTFRVISLSFSNLGGSEVVDNYFTRFGHRPYADKIYSNLGEFYFSKLRYDDATSVYNSFIELNPYHKASPHFGMRVIEIYDKAGFPLLVVQSKKEFATRYALTSQYWDHHDVSDSGDVTGFLKTNLTDLAAHYHSLYQTDVLLDERPAHFDEAQRWYRQFLASFPTDPDTSQTNYRLADLLLENENFLEAAAEYERTAYEYGEHDQASSAGYAAVFAYRQELNNATGAQQREVKQVTVQSSLRFADSFPDHDEAPVVLGAAADDLYVMKDFGLAIASARKLIDRYPTADTGLLRAAWAVVGHSSIDVAEYEDAEVAYTRVLDLTTDDDETRPTFVDGLAAAIYKQAEQANLLEDYRAAADHFLRIKSIAPTSGIRSAAEYDAAAALMRLEDWTMAADVLEEFRTSHPEHELSADATKQLARVYREDGQLQRSALEHERISAEADDPELSREALLTAGDLYDEAGALDEAIRVFESYVARYPRPIDLAAETRSRLAEIFEGQLEFTRYFEQLEAIVALDREAGADRTDRSRYLASGAALGLAEQTYERFARVQLVQPFEESLAEKQARMDEAVSAMQALVDYEVAEVTAAATYYIAQVYHGFSTSLIESERPEGLSEAEKVEYELVIEEEAYPFEEQAIEVHEKNHELLASGIYNNWVQKSLERLAFLMPGRYAKVEISEGFIGSIDYYAYRMPIAPPPPVDGELAIDDSPATTVSAER